MQTTDEKPVTFGAVVEPVSRPLRPAASHDSALSTTAEKETGVDSSNPYSAFYKHPEARRSMDNAAVVSLQQSKTHLNTSVCERDVEVGGAPLSAATTQNPSKTSMDGRVKECTMWPSRQAVMEQKKTHRRAKGCQLCGTLNSKQRLWLKIVIALIVVAAAVGLGVGISRAVGGGVWQKQGQTKSID